MAKPSISDVIQSAIQTAKIDFPNAGDGTTWDQITMSLEESALLTKAVLSALKKAGYEIVPPKES